MANLPKNTLARTIAPKTLFPDIKAVVNSSSTWAEGDLLIFDVATGLLKLPVAEADGAKLVGVSPIAVQNGKPPKVYITDVDASAAIPAQMGPVYGNAYRVILKGGDALVPGAMVYLDPASGAQNVQAAGTKAIGVYYGPAITAAAGGSVIEVVIGARYPTDSLVF